MKESILDEKYKIYTHEILKKKNENNSIDGLLSNLREKIENHEVAKFISIFDHMDHTENLADGEINSDIIDAKIIIFCFGKILKSASILAVRPRSIGVAELSDRFVLSFQDAPNEKFNEVMLSWIKSLELSQK